MRRDAWVAGCALALAVAGCGDAFSTTDDGGTPIGLDGSIDSGRSDAGVKDATGARDAESSDAVGDRGGGGQGDSSGPPPVMGSDGGGKDDDSGPPVTGSDGGGKGKDSGPVTGSDSGGLDAASSCLKTCPSGFDCIGGMCVDRAAQHFGAATTTDNWSYGSFMSFGSTAFTAYAVSWTTNGIVFAGQAKNVLTSSVFHSITSASYEGMSIQAGTLGLYPGVTTSLDTVVRWTSPAAGHFAISATFAGLGTMPPTTVGVSVNIGPVNEIGKTLDGTTPSITYANADVLVAVGDTIDFYVNFVTLSDDEQGGTGLDARITAN